MAESELRWGPKPGAMITVADGHVINVPKVIEHGLSKVLFQFYSAVGLAGPMTLCAGCAKTLEYTSQVGRKVHTYYNGNFRVQYGDDMYMAGHYFRQGPDEETDEIAQCASCGVKGVQGHLYDIRLEEITYAGMGKISVFSKGERVSINGTGLTGMITGAWEDNRIQHRRWAVRLDSNGQVAHFLYWQMRRIIPPKS